MPAPSPAPIPVLYLAPWLDFGGSDKSTIDWFRTIDRKRFRPHLITTQPSPNRWLHRVNGFAEEIWSLPDMMSGKAFPRFILEFIQSRDIRVVHIMNSRLGYNLLPDIKALPDAPSTVVQLHVEEEDRSGYVRYVTTRFGNLVDAFSISGEHVSSAMQDYDVPRAKRHVIYTGVDSEVEFNPDDISPIRTAEPGITNILFPARLTGQKDPLTMVEVAAGLRSRRDDFRIHVVGDGDLARAVADRVEQLDLGEHVLLHGSSHELDRWYAASDVLLLTSAFEGIPCVLFEAMAMRLPIVAPALPGVVELLAGTPNDVIEPRDSISEYVDALERLIADPSCRRDIGARSRDIVASKYSRTGMARAHEALYERLLDPPSTGIVPVSEAPETTPVHRPETITFASRPSCGSPLVSVIVPCYNHGIYLDDCIDAIRTQDYPNVQVIVVDDCSTDAETIEALARLDADSDVGVLRMPRNSGPSAARNAAIRIAAGRYILPVDSDNLLEPGAITALVDQLQSAGAQVGYIYPNLQFFGNRKDYFEAPPFNFYSLLQQNYCDTCSLIDREVFDAGFQYPEDMTMGHEDWDFVVALGARGIYGEVARTKTLRYRKQGFTRSDQVNYSGENFHHELVARHRDLFDAGGQQPVAARLKARWAPALSVVALTPVEDDEIEALVALLERQTCTDAEFIVRTSRDHDFDVDVHVRRIPAALAATPGDALSDAMGIARGRWVIALDSPTLAHLRDPTFFEGVLRCFTSDPLLQAIPFRAEGSSDVPFRLRPPEDDAAHAALTGVSWCRTGFDGIELRYGEIPAYLDVNPYDPLRTVVEQFVRGRCNVQTRAHGSPPAPRPCDARPDSHVRIPVRPPATVVATQGKLLDCPPMLPTLDPDAETPRTTAVPWTPPETHLLVRHIDIATGLYTFSNDRNPPAGYSIDYDLGAISAIPLPGTQMLTARGPGPAVEYLTRTLDDDEAMRVPHGEVLLGHVEAAPLPLLTRLEVARHPVTGQRLLVAGDEDHLFGHVDVEAFVGWIEPVFVLPHETPPYDPAYGGRLTGFTRIIDHERRRHRYVVERTSNEVEQGELGALLRTPLDASMHELVANGDGYVSVSGAITESADTSFTGRSKWAIAPLAWRGVAPASARMRAAARRSLYVATGSTPVTDTRRAPAQASLGWIFPDPAPDRRPLFSSVHPVTGDQYLATDEWEARDLGYADVTLLGYIVQRIGKPEQARAPIPWASKFGLRIG